jgi:hypothetical protein
VEEAQATAHIMEDIFTSITLQALPGKGAGLIPMMMTDGGAVIDQNSSVQLLD